MSSEYRDKLRRVGFLARGRSRPRERIYFDSEGGMVRETTLEGGTVYREYARGDRKDVILRPRTIHVTTVLPRIGG
ncbi:hypothetical protein ACGFIV_00985 [Sphaerisporangium sp. NPDC049003]|uniref:hypothetical protein n=1 Tax=Sphaerisporangium sp. NPDC049003 TaxID=3364517 RepID=UPI0037120E64